MMIWVQWLIFFVSLALQIFVIGLLRRGVYKDYPFVFVYSLVLIMTTVADGAVFAGVAHMDNGLFYRNEALRQLLLFIVVMSLMDRAVRGRPYRGRVRLVLMLSACVAVLVSVQIHREARDLHYNLWATQVGRDLSFGSVVLTLLLWVTLISSHRKDAQLLMVTGGLGLQFTGEAIGQSMRQMSVPHHHILLLAGNLVLTASHLMRLYVWSEAFRSRPTHQEENKKPGDDVRTFRRQAQQSVLAESV
jgi:hypothetical protein